MKRYERPGAYWRPMDVDTLALRIERLQTRRGNLIAEVRKVRDILRQNPDLMRRYAEYIGPLPRLVTQSPPGGKLLLVVDNTRRTPRDDGPPEAA